MLVEGHAISDEQIHAAWMAMQGTFTFRDITGALVKAGVPWQAADRAADRLLQKKRKRGDISYDKHACKWRRGCDD